MHFSARDAVTGTGLDDLYMARAGKKEVSRSVVLDLSAMQKMHCVYFPQGRLYRT